MNIRNEIDPLPQIFSSPATGNSPAHPAKPGAGDASNVDKADLSSAASGLARSVNSSDDVRLDKVANIQKQLEAGTYHVPASDVAKKVLTSLLSTPSPEE